MSYDWSKPKNHASHQDDWLITYADVITLLLCFFAIIVITSAAKKDGLQKQNPATMEQSTKVRATPLVPIAPLPAPLPEQLPTLFSGDRAFRPIEQADFAREKPGNIKSAVESEPSAPEPLAQSSSEPVAEDVILAALFDAPPALTAATPTGETAAASVVVPEPAPPQIAPEKASSGSAPFEQKGDRITSFEMNSAAFFDSGSAVLSKAGSAILGGVAVKLKADDLKAYQITVEGHTDDSPIHTAQFASNWELSTARASAVVHYLLDQGIPATKLRAAGYADTFPKVPNRDDKGTALPQNQAENRRVVIKLEKIETNSP